MHPHTPPDQAAGNKLLAALPLPERRRLASHFHHVQLSQRERLCTAGQRIDYVVFPQTAVTSTLMEMPEGDSVEIGLTGAEGIVGLDLLYGIQESVTTVIVQIPGRGVRMEAAVFRQEILAKKGPFYDALLRYAHVFFGMVAQSAGCNASHAIEQRLGRWLLMAHDRVQRDRFPLTHEFIALMLGVRRASVTQAANTLRAAGAIAYERGDVHVMDRAALELASCACYDVVRRLSDSLLVEPSTGDAVAGSSS
jgi:CRP-like cAMP-binding protein